MNQAINACACACGQIFFLTKFYVNNIIGKFIKFNFNDFKMKHLDLDRQNKYLILLPDLLL